MRDVGGREPVRPRHRRALRRVPALPRRAASSCRCSTPAEARAYVAEVRDKALDVLGRACPLNGRRLVERRVRVRHDRPARAAARRDDARHPPAARRARRCCTRRRRRRAGRCRSRAEVLVPGGRRSPWAPPPSRGRWTTSGRRTVVDVPAFVIDAAPVTNGAVRARSSTPAATTTRAGGAPAGWAHRVEAGLARRAFWQRDGDGTGARRRFGVVEPVPRRRAGGARVLLRGARRTRRGRASGCPPRRSGRRRPGTTRRPAARGATRGATTTRPPRTPTSASATCQPAPVGAYPAGASPLGVHQLIGDVWEWTRLGLAPVPGVRGVPVPRSTREVFFGGDYRVLRGGSFGTDRGGLPRHVPQLGPPDPPADLQRVPLRPGRRARSDRGADRCAATWPTSGRRSPLAALLLDPPHALLRQS